VAPAVATRTATKKAAGTVQSMPPYSGAPESGKGYRQISR
jgi:hypothetical protein